MSQQALDQYGSLSDLGVAPVTSPLPSGIRRLIRLGNVLAARQWPESQSLRIVVTVPTMRLAGLAVSLGATEAEFLHGPQCQHAQLDGTPRLSACYWNRHLQDREAWRDCRGVHVGTSTFTQHLDSVHRLPEGFPARERVPRNANSRSETEIADLALAYGEEPAIAGFRRSTMGAHPVLYMGNFSELRADIDAAMEAPLQALHVLGRLAPGEGYDSWFRHPVIVVHKAPVPGLHPWLDQVMPRLLVRCGQASLLQPMAGLWDAVPHVVLLSRRAPSTFDAIGAIAEMGWRPLDHDRVPASLREAVRPGEGLEVACFSEPPGRIAVLDEEADDDEW